MPEQKKQLEESEAGFYEIEDKLYFVKENGDMFELDFDIQHAIKNKNGNESEMEDTSLETDITPEQNEQNYWVETPKTHKDGSRAMFEKRVSTCMEITGKSREECSKEVKARMKKEGSKTKQESTNTNTSGLKEDQIEEEEEIEEDQEEETKDYAEICPKELDMLRKKAVQYDDLVKERSEEIEKFKSAMDFYDKIKLEREEEQEVKRQSKITALMNDFQIPKGKIENKTIEELDNDRHMIELALNVGESEDMEDESEITPEMESDFQKKVSELNEKYRVKF
jgi:hypothetical protein